jgi:cytochrome c-type biogenesis protein CcmH/NrfF
VKRKTPRVVDASVLEAMRAGMSLADVRAVDAHNAGLSLLAAKCKNQRERSNLAELVRCPHCQAVHMLNEAGELVELRHYTTCPKLPENRRR